MRTYSRAHTHGRAQAHIHTSIHTRVSTYYSCYYDNNYSGSRDILRVMEKSTGDSAGICARVIYLLSFSISLYVYSFTFTLLEVIYAISNTIQYARDFN